MVSIRTGQVSITGNFRENNEDSLVVDEEHRFVIVADGMGGQSAGEKASALAVELIPQKLLQLVDFSGGESAGIVDAIDQSIHHANSEIMALSEVNPSYRNMGTTVVFLVKAGNQFFVGGIGDSRAYELRAGKLKQITTDHSLTQALIEAGTISATEARTHRYRNVLYRYLGTRDGSAGSNAAEITPQPGDRFLLCSDGVTDGIPDDKIAELLQSSDDPQAIAETVVAAAQEGGSRDNISCVVVLVD
ncbi:MAG: serine/threonine-protein phosphatase [Planctomycetaceae bacterium]|nr:serine/threonine-protein phosphatase [Planctomycetaceae bacterium]